MKKFLTVLLVIAVMFTFSFGSAFATPANDSAKLSLSEVQNKIDVAATAKKQANADVINTLLSTLYSSGATTANITFSGKNITIDKAIMVAFLNEKLEEANGYVDAEATTNKLNAARAAAVTGFEAFDGTDPNSTSTVYPGYDAVFNASNQAIVANSIIIITSEATLQTQADALALAKAQLEADKTKQINAIKAIDLSVYSTEVEAGEFKSDNEKAKEIVDSYVALIETTKADTSWAGIESQISTIKGYYTPATGEGSPSGAIYGNTELGALKTVGAAKTDSAKIEYAKSYTLAEIKTVIERAKADEIYAQNQVIFQEQLKKVPNATTIKTAEENIATITKGYDALLEVLTYRIKNVSYKVVGVNNYVQAWYGGATYHGANQNNDSCLGEFAANGSYTPIQSYNSCTATKLKNIISTTDAVKILENIADMKKDAELAKAAIELDGTVYYDVDGDLADAIDAEYMKLGDGVAMFNPASYGATVSARKGKLIGACAAGATVNTIKVDGKPYMVVNEWLGKAAAGDTSSLFDTAKIDEVKAVMAETKKAIRAAKTLEDADKAFLEGFAKYDAIPTAADHQKDTLVSSGALYAKYKKYVAEFKAYVDAKRSYITAMGDQTDYSAFTGNNGAGATAVKNYYAKSDDNTGVFYTECFTEAELDAMFAEAKAFVDNIKSDKEIKAEKKALEAEVAKLAAIGTVEDKAAVEALQAKIDDHNDYCAILGLANDGTYAVNDLAQVGHIQTAESKAIKEAYDKILKDGKTTLDEKAAVEALRTAFDEYVAYYQAANVYSELDRTVTAYQVTDAQISALENTIYGLERDIVEAMIAKLDVTNVDAAAVKAARAAYEALDSSVDIAGQYYDKLVALEKILAVDVQALKIKASSTVAKGSITVKWTVTGNTTSADAYEIWKSTKKNSGFSKAFTTKDGAKRSYKNTKGLKKGTRYYYKVRAITYVDGKKVTSDWSNKAYRVAK